MTALALLSVGAPAVASPVVSAPVSAEQAPQGEESPLTASDEASARTIARLQDAPVEVMSQRTEFGSVFALPDGTMATGRGSGPVWVRQGGDGTNEQDWAAVDLTLQVSTDGAVRPVAQSGGLTFSGASTGDGPVDLVSTTDPDSGVTARVQWDGALPEPRLEGRRAIYAEVEPGVDLVLEATSTGFEQFFVVKDRPAAAELTQFPMSVVTEGGELDASGAELSVVAGGQVVATAGTPMMWDADIDQGRAFPVTESRPDEVGAAALSPMPAWVLDADHGRSTSDEASVARADPKDEPVAAQVVGDGSVDVAAGTVEVTSDVVPVAANEAEVTLAPQADFLQDEDTTFPVVVDPDINFNWGFDTYVLKGYSNTRDGDGDLHVGTYDGGAHVGRAFIDFPVAPIAGKQILGARLELYNYYSATCAARNWQVWNTYPANGSTIWANQPGWATHMATSSETHGYSGSCPGGWSNADITSFAAGWASYGETVGHVGIRAENEADNLAWKYFYSANNGSHIPSIWVTYNSRPNTPTNLMVSPSSTVAGPVWSSSASPRLSAMLSDADVESVNGQFHIYRVSDGAEIASTWVAGTSGAAVILDVAPGLLQNGQEYEFAVAAGDVYLASPPVGALPVRRRHQRPVGSHDHLTGLSEQHRVVLGAEPGGPVQHPDADRRVGGGLPVGAGQGT
ncbi:hypothetical protein ASD16_21285 [Cellulomonas sp. Root485]|nr:hypothetical protein ASD16_21285 [Cellulomonas sp. Root485]